jgi:peptide/nickel transport system substrate-binding protein
MSTTPSRPRLDGASVLHLRGPNVPFLRRRAEVTSSPGWLRVSGRKTLPFPKVLRKDFTVGMVVSENGLDDPDQNFYENYACNPARNYGGYCNREVDALIDRQSIEPDPEKRRRLVWEIERKLIEDDVRPVLFHPRAVVCNQPWVKGMTQMVNGTYNGSRSRTFGWINSCHAALLEPSKWAARQRREERTEMKRNQRASAVAGPLLGALLATAPASAQKAGGILKMYTVDSPASMSILEEATVFAERPMMGVFNNLVMYDQHVKQNSLQSIVPDLATSWSWSEDGTELTFPLRQGVTWHDGKPFTAKDVVCTWDLLTGKSNEKLRVNPRKSSYRNLEGVTTNGDYEVTFHLKRPQPAFITALASGYSPIYPCHVSPRDMRQHPVGTGPFKFTAFKPNEYIKVTRNPNYWKQGRPYLDGIEYTIIKNLSTANLAFMAATFDMTFPYALSVPLLKDVNKRMPQAICELTPTAVNRNLIVNRDVPPFDDPDLRRAMALSLDRQAFIDIISEGQGDIGGVMQPLPEGLWGTPPEVLKKLPGYDPDVQKNRTEAREIMRQLGYGPDNRLSR